MFEKLKSELVPDTPGVRVLCPTRWKVRTDSLKSILDNFEVLQELWEETIDSVKDTEMKARINGVASQMKTFDYYFGICLGHLILKHRDNLSRALQKSDISASEGQEVASMTLKVLKSIRSDDMFNLFWEEICKEVEHFSISPPGLPRRRKAPRRFEEENWLESRVSS